MKLSLQSMKQICSTNSQLYVHLLSGGSKWVVLIFLILVGIEYSQRTNFDKLVLINQSLIYNV